MILALSYESRRRPVALNDVGCRGLESNLTKCCGTKITTNLNCHSGTYAGVRCMLMIIINR